MPSLCSSHRSLLRNEHKVASQVRAHTEVTRWSGGAAQAHPLRAIPVQDREVRALLAGRNHEAHGHHATSQRGIDFRIEGRDEGVLAIQLAGQFIARHSAK